MSYLEPDQLPDTIAWWPVTPTASRPVPVLSGIRNPEDIIETIIDFARHGPYLYPQLCISHEVPLMSAYGRLAAQLLERGAPEIGFNEEDYQPLLDLRNQVRTECMERVRKDLDRVSVIARGGRRDLIGTIANRVNESLELKLSEILRKRTAIPDVTTQLRHAAPAFRRRKSQSSYSRIDIMLCEIAKSHPASHAEVFTALERRVPVPNAEPFRSARSWERGYQRDKTQAHAWLSKRWAYLRLPLFAKGPKKLQ